jgi:hypothetical protein
MEGLRQLAQKRYGRMVRAKAHIWKSGKRRVDEELI